jgi:hypothetical protein
MENGFTSDGRSSLLGNDISLAWLGLGTVIEYDYVESLYGDQ